MTITLASGASPSIKPDIDKNQTVDSVPENEQGDEPHQLESRQMPGKNGAVKVAIPMQPDVLLESKRLAYSIAESAQLLGVHYFSVYRMVQRGKLRACRVLRGKLLVPRSELLKLLKSE